MLAAKSKLLLNKSKITTRALFYANVPNSIFLESCEITERTFQFTLSQPCEVKYLGSSREIEFITEEKDGKKFLT
jgi:hypothetical protein